METEIEDLYKDVLNFTEIFTQLDDEHKAEVLSLLRALNSVDKAVQETPFHKLL